MKKYFLVVTTILFTFLFVSNVKAESSITVTDKLDFRSLEDLRDKYPTTYSKAIDNIPYLKNKCEEQYGKNYKYIVNYDSGYDFSVYENGEKVFTSLVCWESYSNDKNDNIFNAYLSSDNKLYGGLSFHTKSGYLYLYNYSDEPNHVYSSDRTLSYYEDLVMFQENELFMNKNVYWFDTNISEIYFDSRETQYNYGYTFIDSIQLNSTLYKKGDVIIKYNSIYNPEIPPINANKDSIGWGSDFYKYEYFSIDPDRVYDDVYFELDDGGNRKIDKIKYTYIEKNKPDSDAKIEYINAKDDKFLKRFTKSFFSNLRHFSIEIYYPYQVQNYNYSGYWYNSYYKDSNNETVSIFNSHESIKRGKYEQLDLTNKYAVQLIFKTHIDPRFDFLEFHSLGSFNYYFKKNYGQSNTTYDNSSISSDYLDLKNIYFKDLKYVTIDEVNANLSLFFVNKNFGSSNKVRTLFKYDTEMFDVVVFDNEWDDKIITDSDGNEITLKPPINIKPDGSSDSNGSIFENISIENILKNSFKAMTSLFDVIKLLGDFLNMLLLSLPPLFQVVYAWAFTAGIIVIVIKLML